MPQHTRSIAGLKNATIMMVDDEPLNIEITGALLAEAGYQHFVSTSQPEAALDLLRTSQASLLLLDLSMPHVSGIDILQGMQKDLALAHVPVIVLTAAQDPVSRLQALSAGAMDFLSKPVDASELVLRIRNTLSATLYRDYLAQHDGLTDLPDHLQYSERVEAMVQEAIVSGEAGTLMQIGVDTLGTINEALGEQAGNTVLQRVARQLARKLEAWDGPGPAPLLYRLHGGRFALAVPGLADEEAATAIARSLLHAAGAVVRTARSMEVKVTCCMGIAMFPDDGETPTDLINRARLALRQARTLGRNNLAFYRPILEEAAIAALRRSADFGSALGNNELQLCYAPRVDAGTRRLAGAQAVVRWSRTGDLVLEGAPLLALAAQSGLAAELAEWTMGQFVRDALGWQVLGLAVPCVGIGISLGQPPPAGLVEFAGRAVRDGLAVGSICFELHGTGPFLHDSAAIEMIQGLRRTGTRISLAEFGTSNCPLAALAALSPDEVLIPAAAGHGSSNAGTDAEPGPQGYLQAVVTLLASLRVAAVVEGVETPGQGARLGQLHGVVCQGLLAGPLLNADRFAQDWLQVE